MVAWFQHLWITQIFQLIIFSSVKGHRGNINACIVTSSDKLISGSSDKSIRIWELSLGTETEMLQGHSNAVNTLALAKNETILISGSLDKSIRIWDLVKRKQIKVLSSHGDSVSSIRVIKEMMFLSAGKDRVIKLWDLEKIIKPASDRKRNLRSSISEHFKQQEDPRHPECIVAITTRQIQNLVVSPDEKLLLVITAASTIQVWSTSNYEMMNETEIRMNNFHSMPVFL